MHNNEEVRNCSASLAERFRTSSLVCTYKLCDYYSPIPILSLFLSTPSLYAPILNLQDFSFTCYMWRKASWLSVNHHFCIHTFPGLQAERCLHSDSGSTGEHSGGLLEDDVGVPVWLYCDALSAGRRWPGL